MAISAKRAKFPPLRYYVSALIRNIYSGDTGNASGYRVISGDYWAKPIALPSYRIASRAVALYWRRHYRHTNGLTCGNCSKAQRQRCRRDWLYPECPKAIKLESLNKPVIDSEGNTTELGELIADDRAIDLDAWVSSSTWEIGYPKRLVAIAYKLKAGEALTKTDRQYLWRFRKTEQKTLLSM